MKRQEIFNILLSEKKYLEKQFGVKTLFLFGSFIRDENKDASDVDLLVEFDNPPGLFDFFRLQHYLEDILGGLRVDLVMPPAIKPALRDQILAEAVHVA